MGVTASGERTAGALAPGSRPPLAVPRRLLRLRSDAALAERYALGDEAAFDVLYERYRPAVLSVCMGILGAAHDAEDVTQETFSALALALRGDPPQELRPWLARVAHNRAIDVTRRGRQRALTRDGELPEVAAQQHTGNAELAVVFDGIRELPENQRTALLMRELGGHSYSEIAALLDTHEDAVRGLIARARVGLRSYREAAQLPCAAARAAIEAEPDGRRHSRAIRRHLRACPSCRAYRAALRDDARALRAILPLQGGIAGGGMLGGGLAASKGVLVGAGLTQASAACAASVCAAGAVGGIVFIAPLHRIAPVPILGSPAATAHRQTHRRQPVAKPVAVPRSGSVAKPTNVATTGSVPARAVVPTTHVHLRLPAAHAQLLGRSRPGAPARADRGRGSRSHASGSALQAARPTPVYRNGVLIREHSTPASANGAWMGSGTARHNPVSAGPAVPPHAPAQPPASTPAHAPAQTPAQAPAQTSGAKASGANASGAKASGVNASGANASVGNGDHTGRTGGNSADYHRRWARSGDSGAFANRPDHGGTAAAANSAGGLGHSGATHGSTASNRSDRGAVQLVRTPTANFHGRRDSSTARHTRRGTDSGGSGGSDSARRHAAASGSQAAGDSHAAADASAGTGFHHPNTETQPRTGALGDTAYQTSSGSQSQTYTASHTGSVPSTDTGSQTGTRPQPPTTSTQSFGNSQASTSTTTISSQTSTTPAG